MAVFYPPNPLVSEVVETIALKPKVSTKELYELLKTKGLSVSLPNLYKTVAKLTETQVLVKHGEQLLLSNVWLGTLETFVQHAKNTQQEAKKDTLSSMSDEEQRLEYADSLAGLDPLWNDFLGQMRTLYPATRLYCYNSHSWFILGMPNTELRLIERLTQSGKLSYIIGNDTPLDQFGLSLLHMTNCDHKIIAEPPFPKEGYALWVCEDFVVDVIFPKLLQEYFGLFFRTTDDPTSLDMDNFRALFNLKTKCRLRIRRNKKEADKLRKLFEVK